MAAPSGFMGLGPWGGISAGALAVAAVVGGLYAAGVLGPGEAPAPAPDVAEAQSESAETPTPADQSAQTAVIERQTETPEPADAHSVAEVPPATAPKDDPVADAPAAASPRDDDPVATETVATPAPADAVKEPAQTAGSSDPVTDAPAEETVAALTPVPDPQAPATAAPAGQTAEPAAEDISAPETGTADPEVTQEPAALTDPTFDVVRAAPDGYTLVAGTGPVGSTVTLLVDGKPGETAIVDGSGEFVLFLLLDPDPKARVLTLEARTKDQVAVSQEEIILAPSPRQTARAEPQPPVNDPGDRTVEAPAADPQDNLTEDATRPPAGDPQTEVSSTDPVETDTSDPDQSTETATADPTPAPAETTETTETAEARPTAEPEPQSQSPVAVLRADADGVQLVSPPGRQAPVAMDTIALDTISYSDLGEVQLSGRAGRETVIRVYLDNAAVTELPADPEGRWRGLLDGIDPGVYTLRLDALDAEGRVVSRLETPFQREAPDKLAAAASAGDDQQTQADTAIVRAVTVQTGDTLWAISRDRYGEGILYVRVFEANRDQIRDPDLIYPGQVFAIPN
ncbi:MAG: LysM peptidoglycan-binding domain-containing protein [Pseudomonadota bacterium]